MRSFPLFPLGKHVSPKLSAGVLPGGGAGGRRFVPDGRGDPGPRPPKRQPRPRVSTRPSWPPAPTPPTRNDISACGTIGIRCSSPPCKYRQDLPVDLANVKVFALQSTLSIFTQHQLRGHPAARRCPWERGGGRPEPLSARQPGRLRAAA